MQMSVRALLKVKPDKLVSRRVVLGIRCVFKGETMGEEVDVGDQGSPSQLWAWARVFICLQVWQGETVCYQQTEWSLYVPQVPATGETGIQV